MQTRYDLNGVFLLALLGAATAAEAQVKPESPNVISRKPRSLASETRGGCGVYRSVVRW
jgi:hypothetical protein